MITTHNFDTEIRGHYIEFEVTVSSGYSTRCETHECFGNKQSEIIQEWEHEVDSFEFTVHPKNKCWETLNKFIDIIPYKELEKAVQEWFEENYLEIEEAVISAN